MMNQAVSISRPQVPWCVENLLYLFRTVSPALDLIFLSEYQSFKSIYYAKFPAQLKQQLRKDILKHPPFLELNPKLGQGTQVWSHCGWGRKGGSYQHPSLCTAHCLLLTARFPRRLQSHLQVPGLGASIKQVTDPTGDVALALAHHPHFTDGETGAQSRLKASVA